MKRIGNLVLRAWLLTLIVSAMVSLNVGAKAANPLDGKFQTAASGIGTPNLPATTNGPVGLDYNPVSDLFLVSLNYNTGQPNVFDSITAGPNPVVTPFSTVAGLTTEIKIATVRESSGGFTVGDTFYGVPGVGGTSNPMSQIFRFPNGSSTPVLFATLPEGAKFDVYPYKDTTGVFGGDLIVASSSGNVYRINAAGAVTTIAKIPSLNLADDPVLEGLTVVPNDPKYGTWAGRAVIVSEQDHGFYAVSPAGLSAANPNGVYSFTNLGINLPEDIRIVPCAQNLYIADFAKNNIMGVSAADLEAAGVATPTQNHFLVDEEVASGSSNIWDVVWDPVAGAFTKRLLTVIPQAEQITFTRRGLGPIPDATLTITGTVTENGSPLNGVTVTLKDGLGNPIGTTTTNASGVYSFTGLTPGGSFIVSVPNPGPGGAIPTQPNPVRLDNLIGCPLVTTVNFQYTPPQVLLSISGIAYCDANRNGVPDAGEARSGITVTLKDSMGNVLQTTTTTSDQPPLQNYIFNNLPPGTYTVTVSPTTLPDGCVLVSMNPLTVTLVNTPSTNNNFRYLPPSTGATRTWGFYKTHLDFFTSVVNAGCINLGVLTCTSAQMPPNGGTQDLTHPSLAILEAIFDTAPGKSTTKLGQARLQLAHQLIAAEANVCMLGTTTASKGFSATLIADAVAALDGTNTTLMGTLEGQLDSFNNSGDNTNLPNGLQEGKADPKGAKAAADPAGPGCAFL